ncbi:MAG TPA: hypothetical protein VFO86_03080, partial [Terriglobia bacterium]|nr:hypothetical protein [Terriglobia bacterium]
VNNPTSLNRQKTTDSSASAQTTQVKVTQSQTADITIVTAEGDTVTLSASRSVELSLATYNAQGKVGDSSAAVSGVSAELQRSSDFSITVDGDLNKEELKEIRTAFRTIQKAATDVLKGHDERAAARTAKLGDLDQIASIDADLEFNREVSVTQVSAKSETTSAPETSEVPATTTVSSPVPAPSSDAPQTQPSEPVAPPPSWTPVDLTTTAATSTTATAATHLSVVLQIQAGATSESASNSSTPGLWWFPSQDLWNTLHPKNDSLAQAVPASEKVTPVTA